MRNTLCFKTEPSARNYSSRSYCWTCKRAIWIHRAEATVPWRSSLLWELFGSSWQKWLVFRTRWKNNEGKKRTRHFIRQTLQTSLGFNAEQISSSKNQPNLSEVENKSSVQVIHTEFQMRYDSNGNAIRQPQLKWGSLEERTKELLQLRGEDYDTWANLAKKIWIKTEFAVCLAQSETGIWIKQKAINNYFNCGNNDRGNTISFWSFEEGFLALGSLCLNGKFLKAKTTLHHLYPNHHESSCQYSADVRCQYVYASSPERAGNNVMNCLGNLYQKQITMDYLFRL